MNLKDSQTLKNLVKAFAGESQAHVRYQFLEYGAKQEKLFELAKAIKTISENEFHHARMFYTAIQSSSDTTIENLELNAGYPFKEKWDFVKNFEFAVANETEEHQNVYPAFAKTAQEEGFADRAALFTKVAAVENCHSMLLSEIHTHLKNGTLYKRNQPVKWKCSQCGYEATGNQAWHTCPLCKMEQGYVMLHLSDSQN